MDVSFCRGVFLKNDRNKEKKEIPKGFQEEENHGLKYSMVIFENTQSLAIDIPTFLDSYLYPVAIMSGLVFYCSKTNCHKR